MESKRRNGVQNDGAPGVLDEGSTRSGATVIDRRLLTIQEVAIYTGLAVPSLYTMVSQRRIPFVKMGRLTKFDLRTLDAWIEKNSVRALNHYRSKIAQRSS
jgi:excisionase family DNA binding protein